MSGKGIMCLVIVIMIIFILIGNYILTKHNKQYANKYSWRRLRYKGLSPEESQVYTLYSMAMALISIEVKKVWPIDDKAKNDITLEALWKICITMENEDDFKIMLQAFYKVINITINNPFIKLPIYMYFLKYAMEKGYINALEAREYYIRMSQNYLQDIRKNMKDARDTL